MELQEIMRMHPDITEDEALALFENMKKYKN
jgi:hypothetical protein